MSKKDKLFTLNFRPEKIGANYQAFTSYLFLLIIFLLRTIKLNIQIATKGINVIRIFGSEIIKINIFKMENIKNPRGIKIINFLNKFKSFINPITIIRI